uniref:Secreted protein n=1 Tax=Ixodes ricinus TaxID=34613 RepID=V5H6L8_IXORI
MWSLVSCIAVFLYMQLRPAIKWVLRNLTRLCELQRICYGTERGCQADARVGVEPTDVSHARRPHHLRPTNAARRRGPLQQGAERKRRRVRRHRSGLRQEDQHPGAPRVRAFFSDEHAPDVRLPAVGLRRGASTEDAVRRAGP